MARPEKFRTYEKTQFIIHSAGGGLVGSLAEWEETWDWGVYSTFFILNSGQIIQFVDSSFEANANGSANQRAISVETQSPVNTDFVPWNDKQLEALKKLIQWSQKHHPIPNRTVPSIDDPGVGFHTMFGNTRDRSTWLKLKPKVCPGISRIHQFYTEIMPGIGYQPAEDEEDVVFSRWTNDPRRKTRPKPPVQQKTKRRLKNRRASLDWNSDGAFQRSALALRDDEPFTRLKTET
jgi:hypothetical protein